MRPRPRTGPLRFEEAEMVAKPRHPIEDNRLQPPPPRHRRAARVFWPLPPSGQASYGQIERSQSVHR
jgi:hypothetical protein